MLWLPVTYDTEALNMFVCFGLARLVAPENQRDMFRVAIVPGT